MERLCLGRFFLAIEIIVFNKNFVDAVESIDSQTKKDILSRIIFCKVLEVWKLPIWPCSGLIYTGFKHFIYKAKNKVTLFMRGNLSRAAQLFQNELRLANWTFFFYLRLNFSHLILILSEFYSFSLLSFSHKLFD